MKYFALVAILVAVSCGRVPAASSADSARASARRHSLESLQVLDLVAARIADFYSRRQERIAAFSDEVFSFRGKWRALFWSRDDFERHVRRRFEEHVFRPEDFEREVLAPVRGDLAFAIDACEAAVAADLDGWARAGRPNLEGESVRPALSRQVAGYVVEDLGLNIASIVGSEVAAVATSAILARAGILGTSLAAGGGTSWATLGIGLVAGTIAGIAIDAAVGDELEETARESVRLELDGLRRTMLESPEGLWHAARRVLEAHGRALEKSAASMAGGTTHGSGGA